MKAPYSRIPSLDGIRALAVAVVVACHLLQRFPPKFSFSLPVDAVQVFFVLSGFLITHLLLRELADTGSIDAGSFYKRRAMRILPPFYVYLGFVALLCIGTAQTIPWHALGSAALFLSNIDPAPGSVFTEHVWSLAVEEQFYLIWPILLILALRRGGRRRAAQVAIGLVLLSPILRVALNFIHAGTLSHHQAILLPTRMDSLFSGCLFALLIDNKRFEHLYARALRYWWLAPLFLVIVSPLLRLLLGNAYTFTIGYTVESLVAAFFILWATRNPATRTGRFLNWKPMRLLGLASYSVYLYQMPLIQPGTGLTWESSPERIVPAIALAGLLSFYLVERPISRLREKLAARSRRLEARRLSEPQAKQLERV